MVGSNLPVRGAIVLVGAKEITIREQPDDVAVLGAPQLVRWLKKQPPILEPAQVTAVTAAVRDEATWTNEPSPLPDSSRLPLQRRSYHDGPREELPPASTRSLASGDVDVEHAEGRFDTMSGSRMSHSLQPHTER